MNIERSLIENLSIQFRYTDNGRFRSKLTTDFAVLEQSANIESLGIGLLGTIKLPLALALAARVGGDRIKIKQCGELTAAGVAFFNQCEKQYKWASSIGLSVSKELIKNTILEVGFERRDISKLKPSFGFSSYQNTYSMSLGYRF
jgi:pyrroloquinoline quinone (PQQ) biosynthesis protein C